MRTITEKMFRELPVEVQQAIESKINERVESVANLKERTGKLKVNVFRYRTDTNQVTSAKRDDEFYLVFDQYHKTAGEQWGNCAGLEITVKSGAKYINCELEHYRTDEKNYSESKTILPSKLAEIIDLLELADNSNDQVDREITQKQAVQQFFLIMEG